MNLTLTESNLETHLCGCFSMGWNELIFSEPSELTLSASAKFINAMLERIAMPLVGKSSSRC